MKAGYGVNGLPASPPPKDRGGDGAAGRADSNVDPSRTQARSVGYCLLGNDPTLPGDLNSEAQPFLAAAFQSTLAPYGLWTLTGRDGGG
jgi:hypothetical protein